MVASVHSKLKMDAAADDPADGGGRRAPRDQRARPLHRPAGQGRSRHPRRRAVRRRAGVHRLPRPRRRRRDQLATRALRPARRADRARARASAACSPSTATRTRRGSSTSWRTAPSAPSGSACRWSASSPPGRWTGCSSGPTGSLRCMSPGRPTRSDEAPVVEVRRSRKRRRTVAAYREDDKVVVLIPARFTRAEEKEWVEHDAGAPREVRAAPPAHRRGPREAGCPAAARVPRRAGAKPLTVRWVDNQNSRWGSCTPGDRSIRLSTRLQGMPSWVIDYVLVHELAHLIEAGHTPAFWAWVDRFPKAERAKGFLEGVARCQLASPLDTRTLRRRAQMALTRRAAAPHAREQVGVVGGQRVDRPPPHVERLLADRVGSRLGCDGDEAYVEVAHALVRAAERDLRARRGGPGPGRAAGRRRPTPRRPHGARRRPASRRRPRSARRGGTSAAPWRAGSAAPGRRRRTAPARPRSGGRVARP